MELTPIAPLLLVTKAEPRSASAAEAVLAKFASSEKLTIGASVVEVVVVLVDVVVDVVVVEVVVVVGTAHDFPSPSNPALHEHVNDRLPSSVFEPVEHVALVSQPAVPSSHGLRGEHLNPLPTIPPGH